MHSIVRILRASAALRLLLAPVIPVPAAEASPSPFMHERQTTVWQIDDVPVATPPPAGDAAPPEVDPNLSEQELITQIKRLCVQGESQLSPLGHLAALQKERVSALRHIDALHERFPNTLFRDEATILKLQALAELARTHPVYLKELLEETQRIAESDATGRLAEENAFYAIQAFVLGARHESMPEDRRSLGTIERYQAFLKDHPLSPHAPVIWASLIRSLLQTGQTDAAARALTGMQRLFPEHPATRRADGEVRLALSRGKTYTVEFPIPDGAPFRSTDHAGKVVVVHFWSAWSEPAVAGLKDLAALRERISASDLHLVGVNVDRSEKAFRHAVAAHQLTWPQYFDGKGVENDVLVKCGVTSVPTYLVLDRSGVLHVVRDGGELASLVERLVPGGTAIEPERSGSPR
jgi:hypothetical protein